MREQEFNPRYKEENDCYLVAYCACFNVNYEDAKNTGITSSKLQIIKVISAQGYEFNQIPNSIWKEDNVRLVDFVSKNNVGTFYVLLKSKLRGKSGHAVALIDGTVYDAKNHTNYQKYLVDGYFVIKSTRSGVKNSYLSDSQELTDFALDYIQKKLAVNPTSSDTYIKVVRQGTNNLDIYINGKVVASIELPFNSSKAKNLLLIKKLIDKSMS